MSSFEFSKIEKKNILIAIVLGVILGPLLYFAVNHSGLGEAFLSGQDSQQVDQSAWQEYQNRYYDYALDYPQDWQYKAIHTLTDEEVPNGYRVIFLDSEDNNRLTLQYDNNNREALINDPETKLVQSITVNLAGTSGAKDKYRNSSNDWTSYYIKHDEVVYSLSYSNDSSDKDQQVIDQMVNSFHFLDSIEPVEL